MNKKLFLTIIISLLLFVNYCRKENERETLKLPKLNKRRYKDFIIEIAEINFIKCKTKIYKETVLYSFKKLIGINIFKNKRKKIISIVKNNRINLRNFFLVDYNKVLSRSRVGKALLIKMRVVIKIRELIRTLRKIDLKKYDLKKLRNAPLIIPYNNERIIKKINQPEAYIRPFADTRMSFWYDKNFFTMKLQTFKTMLPYIYDYLNNLNITVVQYNYEENDTEYFKNFMTENNINFFVLLSDKTVIKKLLSGNYKLSSLINLKLLKKGFKKISETNIQIERIFVKKSTIPIFLKDEIITRGLANLLKKTSFQLTKPRKFYLILKNASKFNFVKIFLKHLSDANIDYLISFSSPKLIKIELNYSGTRISLQKKILQVLEANNLQNKFYLTNSKKNLLEFSLLGVND